MSKRFNSKLLSIILCLAICCATLCGSLIAAHAAAADYNGTYTISVGDDKQAVPYAATEVKAQVKFDLPAGFVGGEFTAKAQSDYTIGDKATVVAGTKKDGTALTADELANVEIVTKANGSNKDIRFVIGDGVLCTSITIEYTLVFNKDKYVNNGNTSQYLVGIDVDGANFGVNGDYADVEFTASADSDTFFHSHSSWYATAGLVLDAEKNGKHTVTLNNARCHLCTHGSGLGLPVNDNYIAQVLPDYTEFEGATTPLIPEGDTDGGSTTAWIGISGVTVSYNANGELDVDVHVYSQWRSGNGDKIVLIICDKEGNELYRLAPVPNGSSYFAGVGFPAEEKKFTISGLSAKNLDTELLLTAVEYSSGSLEISRTMSFCLADWCEKVVTGNGAVWADGATDEQIEADKDVAAALYYYGASIQDSVFDKNTAGGGSTSGIEYVNANYDEWDGTTVQPTKTDSEGNIVISTAEELAWIALEGAANTANKNYKVVDNSVFNMKGMDGITMNSTAAQVESAGKARVAASQWSADHNWRLVTDNAGNAFVGNFDGNGLVVYNIFSRVYAHAGLFPCTNPAVQGTQTIKNVAVYASFMSGYHYSGGIVGLANAPSGTGYTMKFDSCATKNSYIDDMSSTHERTTGTIVGGLGHNTTVINNCLALNNKLVSTGIIGGFFGNTSNYGGDPTVSNSLTIGSTIVPTSVGIALGTKVPNTTYTNVYDEDVDAATLGSAWFDTETYPELSIFHKLSKQYVDENTHKVICVLKAGGNACTLKGVTEEHTLVKNAEGNAKVCECGYSVPVYKDIEYITANYDEWDGTTSQPTETDSEGNIIIRNAEQLAWIALEGAANTANKNYKVVDNSVFNMKGMDGITMNSTAAQVESAGKARIAASQWSADHNWRLVTDNAGNAFVGNFDGNGLVVYNIFSRVYAYAGLFPCTNPAVQGTQTIKNVAVYASFMSGYHYSGGIVGNANAPSGTGYTMNFDSCATKNSYIDDMSSSNERTTGTIVGGLGHNTTVINNCLALNNKLVSTGIIGGFFGNTSNYGGNPTVSNSLSIGSTIVPTSVGIALGTKVPNTTYTNVYDEDVDAATLGSAWFDTETYPELSIFHKMTTEYVNDSTHNSVCTIVANGIKCTVCGTAEEHTFTQNVDKMECTCGYYEYVIGNRLTPTELNYDEWDGTKVQPTKTDSEGNIIISTAEELAWIALEGADATANKNYKVVDNSVFNMKGMDGITMNSTAAQVETAGKARVAASQWSADHNWRLVSDSAGNAFVGNFDGNGLVVYNIFSRVYAHAGLFPCTNPAVQGTQTIKNVAVYASFMSGYHYSGGIVGLANAPSGTGYTMKFDSCATKNSYIDDMSSSNERTTGTIVGGLGHNTTVINNCLAVNNKLVSTGIIGGFFGNTSNYGGNPTVSNSLTIGSTIVPTSVGIALGTKVPNTTYTNVYDEDVDAATLGSAWFNTTTYPELSIFHDMQAIYEDENTHKTVCGYVVDGVQCTVCGTASNHELVINAAGTEKVCACGIKEKVVGNVVVPNHVNYDEWDGTRVQPTAQDTSGNIIITTAEELAWIALEGGTATNDVNYKVRANSVFNMKGMDGITLNSTAADIKAASKKWQMRWVPYVDGTATDTGNVTFGGNFDGNGLTVYNISGGAGGGVCYQGLFPVLKQSANGVTQEIKNVQIVASYFVGYHNAGALIGSVPAAPGTDCKLNIENISVKNCYITDNANTNAACSRTVGVIAGNVGHNKTTVNNCFAINNELVATNIYGGLIANTSQWSSGVVINNSVIIGTPKAPIDILDDGKNIETPAANTTYTNVHTDDVAAATLGSAWFDTTTYPELKIFHDLKTIYIDENTHQTVCQHFVNGVQCSVSQAICGHTMVGNADNTYTECECGFGYEIKGIHAMNLPACILERITNNTIYNERFATNALFKAAYSADVFGTDVQENVFDLYATSLNLKVNPHIAFTFAFHGDYKTNKANITATFSVEGQVIATVTGDQMINNSGAGRYHLYRLKSLDVTKLSKPVTVTVTYGGSTYDFGTYSAAGYAINAMNAGADYQEHVNASMALVYYSEMLAERQGK